MFPRRLLIRCCLGCLATLATAQQAFQDEPKILDLDRPKIIDLEKKWTDAYRQHNLNVLTSLLAEDFIITIEDGRTFGKIGYLAHTADSATQVDLAEESDLKVRMHGNVAIVTGAYHETGNSKGKRYEYRDRLTDVWMKINGQWQIIASQYSVPVQQ